MSAPADQPAPQPQPLRDSFGVAICNRECPHWLGDSCELNRKWLIAEKDPCIPQARRDAAELVEVRAKALDATAERDACHHLFNEVMRLCGYDPNLPNPGIIRAVEGKVLELKFIEETLTAERDAAQAEVATARNLADWAAGIVEIQGKELQRLRAIEVRAQSLHNCELIGCLQCGPTNCDEDGTCMTCGMDTTLAAPSALLRWILTGNPGDAPEET